MLKKEVPLSFPTYKLFLVSELFGVMMIDPKGRHS